jgi:hypothetical protein
VIPLESLTMSLFLISMFAICMAFHRSTSSFVRQANSKLPHLSGRAIVLWLASNKHLCLD